MYTHITHQPIERLEDNSVKAHPIGLRGGKPIGFWFAPDRAWVGRMAALGIWNVTGGPAGKPAPYVADIYRRIYETRDMPPAQPTDKLEPVPPMDVVHYVYRFSLDGKFESDINAPAADKVFRLTAETEPSWNAKFVEWATPAIDTLLANVKSGEFERYMDLIPRFDYLKQEGVEAYLASLQIPKKEFTQPKNAIRLVVAALTAIKTNARPPFDPRIYHSVRNRLLGQFFQSAMAPVWGGIVFDESLFARIEPGSMIAYLEYPSGCLWKPASVLGLVDGKLNPSAVIARADSPESAATREKELEAYAPVLFVVGITTEGGVVFFKAGTPSTAGKRRGRTFRNKPMRRNKYGSRLARKSQRRRWNRDA